MNSTKKTARLAGLLWLLTAATAGFSLVYVRPKLIVFGDAATTANNILAFESLFRAAIASYILSQIFSLFFGLTIFRLFKGVNKTLATMFLTSLLVSAGVGVVNSLNNIGALVVLTNPDYLKAFQPAQLNALAMIFLRVNNFGIGLVEIFSALYMFSFGLLIMRSRYLPRVLGILIIIGACAFPINTFTKILIPQFYPALMTRLTMLLNAFGPPATMLWLLIKGVNALHPISED
ncbi:MAG TPA: DUF4386 domain-containing protein [Pyrinomonadaceae bacterium]|nr:DUF4386 domain-containing protein [Pyrinomonadaceae bacterium]